jgi:hypothetical protein
MPITFSRPVAAKILALGWIALSVAALVPVVGPVMHESDQASLLYGAERLARGAASPWAADFYNYDKQYLTYWLLALLRRLLPGADLVTLGNVFSFSVFWGGALAAILTGRIRRFGQAAALGACVLAPALWMHSPFLGTNSLSFGFLLLAWAAWPRAARSPGWRVAALLLIGLAVGCRADALLVLPWFAWTVTPAGGWRALLRRPVPYWIAGAGLATFLVGRIVFTGAAVYANPPYFSPKLYAAYLVFGLGAAVGVLVWLGLALLAVARRRSRQQRPTAAFYVLGFLGLLLPWAYYSTQLFSTRYWTPLLCALIGGLLSRRGRILVAWARHPRIALGAAVALLTGALAPLLVGIHLPFPNRPSLVTSEPTLFPTGDGLQPMGAMGSFLHALAVNPGHVVDHNQATWLSAVHADLQPDETGRVPILEAPLKSYLLLAATLRGLEPHIVPEQAPAFYTDARDLLRIFRVPDRLRPVDRRGWSRTLRVRPAGPEMAGYVIVRAEHTDVPEKSWLERLRLAQAVNGNEFHVRPEFQAQRDFSLPRRDEGMTVILFSRQPFAVSLLAAGGARRAVTVQRSDDPPLFLAVVPGADWFGARFLVTQGEPEVGVTVHPDYMSIDRL